MARQTIAAVLISNDITSDSWWRCIESVAPWVDAIYVNYNGPEGVSLNRHSDTPIYIHHFEWEDDFAKARNQSIAFAKQGGECDWFLWIDTDDTLEGGEKLQDLLASLDPKTQGVFLRYDYAVDPDTGQVLAVQWRERLLRTDANWMWQYPIHEVCHAPVGTQYARKHEVWIKHNRDPLDDRTNTRIRNRRILAKARRENPDVHRFDYYFANEVYAEAATAYQEGRPALELINAAVQAYRDFLPNAPSPDDAYIACHQIAELLRYAKDYMGALESEAQAMMIHPSWPDAYVGMAQVYMENGDWDKCEHWANAALLLRGEQETTQIREPLNDEYIPRLLLGIAKENQRDYEGALEQYNLLLAINNSDEVRNRIAALEDLMEREVEVLQSPGDALKQERDELFGTKPEKSIAFFTAPLFEPWHPRIASEGGIGGAETCVMEVAQRFAADGWRTVVFGTPGQYRGVDPSSGIEWWATDDFSPVEEFTVFVSSRCAEIFDNDIKAKQRVLWFHDVNLRDTIKGPWGNRSERIDTIIGLTDWHVNHMKALYPEIDPDKFVKVPNGVDISRYEGLTTIRQPHKFIFSSSPDRGVDVVLEMWPRIKKDYPDAELHVFYGWTAIDKILEMQPENQLIHFKEAVEGALKDLNDPSIVWHDRVDQKTLAYHQSTCDMWLYPTYFLETFCITAIEMQAAGVIPLVNGIGALPEVVANDNSIVHGWPNNESLRNDFVDRLNWWQDLPEEQKNFVREGGKAFAASFSWDAAYQRWLNVIDHA